MSDLVVTLRLSGNADGAVTAVRLVKRETDGLGDSTERAARRGVNAFDGMTGSLKGFAKQAAASALAAVGIGAVGAVLGASVGNARAFGAAMGEVSTLLPDTSEMDALTQSVRAMSREYGQAPTGQAKALYEIISAGISDTAQANEVLEQSNRLALGGITEVAIAADGLTTVLNAYGPAAGNAAEVSDRLFVAALAGKTNIEQLSQTIGNAAPIAAQTGVSLDELLASVSALTLGGVKTSTAVDGIRAVIASVIKPSQEATQMAAALGLQFDATALKSQGLAGFLQNVEEATGGSADKLAVLFGGVEALAPVMALTGNQAEAFTGILDQMSNSAGMTSAAVEKMAGTADFQIKRLSSAIGDSLLSVGDSILNTIAPAAQLLADNWEAIASGISVATQVTAVWLGVFVAVPALWAAATAAVTAYATARAAATVADEMGMARSVASITALQAAGGLLVGAFAGWQIGTWLRENFLEAELAGIAFVEGTLVGYERLKQGVLIVWEGIKAGGVAAMNAVREAIATMFANLASAADVEVFGEKLFGSTSEGLRELEAAIRPAKSSAETLAEAVGKINSEADKQVESIRALTGDMAQYATEQSNAAETAGTLATATEKVTTAAGAAAPAIALTAEEIKRADDAMAGLAEISRNTAEALGGPMVENAISLAEELAKVEKVEQELIATHKLSAEAADQLRRSRGQLIESYQDEQAEVIAAQNSAQALLAEMEQEIRLASMSADARRQLTTVMQFEQMMRQAINDSTAAGLVLSDKEVAALMARARAYGELKFVTEETADAAQFAARESQRAWEDLSTGMSDAVLGGSDGVKRYWKQLIDDLKRQLLSSGLLSIFGKIFNTGGAQSGNSLLGQLFSGGGNPGGAASQGAGGLNIGSLLGSVGGLLGGTGTGFGTGLLASGSIFSGAGLLGGITGSISAGVSSILGGSIMQGVGLLAGPVGLIVGAVSLLASVIKKDKPPDFRVGGTGARVRGVEGNFETVFGQVNAGSRQISWESLVGPMQQFDSGIQDLVNTMGGGQPQIDAIRDTLSRWVVDLKGNAATAENVLGSRFAAVLTTFSTDVQAFVGSTGTVQEQVARLTDALSIEKIVDTGALGESFAEVSALLTEYRVGTEAIADTYARVLGSVTLLDEALALSGTTLDLTRDEMIRFAADITEAAGGLDRAQALWASYFQSFYTEAERAEFNRTRAQANAASQAGDVGLNLGDFTGTGGMAAARQLFNSQLPTLSAEATVQWLEFLDALATFTGLSSEATEAVAGVSTSLTDLMSSVTEQLEQYAPPQTFAQRLQAINVETDTMIAQARALGATEEQLGQIRALSAARQAEVLDEQAAAMLNYQTVVQGINDELADARGLSEFQREMREIDRTLASNIASMNEAARAAGMQGAAEADLAAAHELAAIRAAQAIARLEERGRSVVQELYGTPLERLNEQIAEIEAGIGGFSGGFASGMEQVTQATDNAVQAQLGAQQRIRDWLDNLMIGDLGGLRPRDAMAEAQALFDRTLQAALGGDADAMGQLPQLADQLLRLGQRVYASGDPYFDLRDAIRDALAQVAGLAVENPLPVGGGTGGGMIGNDQGGGFGGNGDLTGLYAERDRLIAEQRAAERLDLARELTGYIREIVTATGRPLDEIETTLGFSMVDLVTDLGVNLNELTVATASQLADIATATGTELTDLAASVGVDLGSLADRQSLLNDALEAEIGGLPQEQRDQLAPLLRRVEDAAALGDTAGVEAGIGDMEDAIGEMSPELRDLLAPYFLAIKPADPVTEIGHLSAIDAAVASSYGELTAQTGLLQSIYDVLNAPAAPSPPDGPLEPGGGFPGYAVGTSYVPSDGLAFLHRGEAVFPASVSEFFRREGIPIRPMPVLGGGSGGQSGAGNDALLAELATVIRDLMRDPERALDEIETTLGFSMADLVTDLGVNLDLLTVATASQLADIAQATGSELSDLAASVGVDLGSLADRQSLLNDALEAEIGGLPQAQRDLLAPLLQRVEDAAALGDTTSVEAGIGDMEDAIAEMSPELRDLLAPYFLAIRPADPVTEIGHLSAIDATVASSYGELTAQTGLLQSIYDVLNAPAAPSPPDGPLGPGGGFPGYAVGTSYVPSDGLAFLHRGEAVFPASVSEFFRREGIPIRPMPVLGGGSGGQSGAGNDALLAELREMSRKLDEGNADRRRMEQRIQQLETTTARGDDAKVRAVERQTDAIKARR